MNSLANTSEFPAGRGVAVNREMMGWGTLGGLQKEFITAWDGSFFRGKPSMYQKSYPHACELPAVEEKDENSFVRDGVMYVAHEGNCKNCDVKKDCWDNKYICGCKKGTSWKRATQPRPLTAVEIAKRYGKGGYAFAYNLNRDTWSIAFSNVNLMNGICLIDDLCEDVSKSPWFMPMVDESGNVTEVRCG